MMKKYLTCSELCSRWGINKFDLADIFFDGKLRAYYAEDLSCIQIVEGGSVVQSHDGEHTEFNPGSLPVDEVTKLIFLISDIKEYEKRHGKIQESPTPVLQKPTEEKRSRSSGSKDDAIMLANRYIDQQQKKGKPSRLHEAATEIQPKLLRPWDSQPWPIRTIKGWIKSCFPDEAKKPGRPKKEK